MQQCSVPLPTWDENAPIRSRLLTPSCDSLMSPESIDSVLSSHEGLSSVSLLPLSSFSSSSAFICHLSVSTYPGGYLDPAKSFPKSTFSFNRYRLPVTLIASMPQGRLMFKKNWTVIGLSTQLIMALFFLNQLQNRTENFVLQILK